MEKIVELIDNPVLLILVFLIFLIFAANKGGFFSKLGRDKTAEVTQSAVYAAILILLLLTLSQITEKNGRDGLFLSLFALVFFGLIYLIKSIYQIIYSSKEYKLKNDAKAQETSLNNIQAQSPKHYPVLHNPLSNSVTERKIQCVSYPALPTDRSISGDVTTVVPHFKRAVGAKIARKEPIRKERRSERNKDIPLAFGEEFKDVKIFKTSKLGNYKIKDIKSLLKFYRNASLLNSFDSWLDLAKILVKTRNIPDAIVIYKKLLVASKRSKNRVQYISVLSALAYCYKLLGEFDKSKKLYLESLSLNSEKISRKHIARDSFNLGKIYEAENKLDLAKSMLLKSKEYSEKIEKTEKVVLASFSSMDSEPEKKQIKI